eukprot:340708_1
MTTNRKQKQRRDIESFEYNKEHIIALRVKSDNCIHDGYEPILKNTENMNENLHPINYIRVIKKVNPHGYPSFFLWCRVFGYPIDSAQLKSIALNAFADYLKNNIPKFNESTECIRGLRDGTWFETWSSLHEIPSNYKRGKKVHHELQQYRNLGHYNIQYSEDVNESKSASPKSNVNCNIELPPLPQFNVASYMYTPYSIWNSAQVIEWMKSMINLTAKQIELITINKIEGKHIQLLNDHSVLQSIGFTEIDQRFQMITNIKELKSFDIEIKNENDINKKQNGHTNSDKNIQKSVHEMTTNINDLHIVDRQMRNTFNQIAVNNNKIIPNVIPSAKHDINTNKHNMNNCHKITTKKSIKFPQNYSTTNCNKSEKRNKKITNIDSDKYYTLFDDKKNKKKDTKPWYERSQLYKDTKPKDIRKIMRIAWEKQLTSSSAFAISSIAMGVTNKPLSQNNIRVFIKQYFPNYDSKNSQTLGSMTKSRTKNKTCKQNGGFFFNTDNEDGKQLEKCVKDTIENNEYLKKITNEWKDETDLSKLGSKENDNIKLKKKSRKRKRDLIENDMSEMSVDEDERNEEPPIKKTKIQINRRKSL